MIFLRSESVHFKWLRGVVITDGVWGGLSTDGRTLRGSSVSGQKHTVTLGSLLVLLIELVIPRFGSRSSERVFRADQFGLWVIMWVSGPVKLKALSNE